ncbi:MAG: cupin domain-containing protein [Proteobacteria bacterium]|nr:cupin domain-containing protein [Pseudomonadota bacterium]
MLKLPDNLSTEEFLSGCWQKKPLFMPQALSRIRPAVTRNEIGWLATLEDVESRIVFVERGANGLHYRAKSGPFETQYLQGLPKRDWTLLVHDVEKHLPAMRALFAHVSFIPDWRIDDLMVSFAAPGGGVGPHRDQYDVFLCQGTGIRNWQFTTANVASNSAASSDLALLHEFVGDESHDAAAGDVLYLPPGVAHWGTATRACITYSIGMRAPQISDLMQTLAGSIEGNDAFYADPDLEIAEARPGYLSAAATRRARLLLSISDNNSVDLPVILGRFVTQTKEWLTPDGVDELEVDDVIGDIAAAGGLVVHGMARIAFDDRNIYLNGRHLRADPETVSVAARICASRGLQKDDLISMRGSDCGIELLKWLLMHGAFDLNGDK